MLSMQLISMPEGKPNNTPPELKTLAQAIASSGHVRPYRERCVGPSAVPHGQMDRVVVGPKVVFKENGDANGEVECYKYRFMAKGFRLVTGLDSAEKYAPALEATSANILLAIVVMNDRHRATPR